MPANAAKLTSIVEEYLGDLRRLRASGGATGELSTYPALANLLNAVGATDELAESAARGRKLAALLDSDTLVPGVTAGWGHFGSGQAVMPGQGRAVERAYTSEERKAMGDAVSTLGDTTFDVYLNDRAYWRNVPANVWSYKLGGYQVLKKWLSYRERKVLGRSLRPDEVQHFAEVGRKVAGISGLVG